MLFISSCSAIALCILGVLKLLSLEDIVENPFNLVLAIYYIVFSVLILGTTFKKLLIVKWFRFIVGYQGRGMFFIFIGTMCISKEDDL